MERITGVPYSPNRYRITDAVGNVIQALSEGILIANSSDVALPIQAVYISGRKVQRVSGHTSSDGEVWEQITTDNAQVKNFRKCIMDPDTNERRAKQLFD